MAHPRPERRGAGSLGTRVALGCALLVAGSAGAAELTLSLRAAPEIRARNPDSPFDAAADLIGTGRSTALGEVVARGHGAGLTAVSSLRLLADTEPSGTGSFVVNELFYDASVAGEHFTLGKKVMSWDVGWAFRPLDVVEREDRRGFNPYALEGVPVIAWEHFEAESAWALVWANPLNGAQAGQLRDDQAVDGKYYRRIAGVDVHVLGRFSHRDRLGLGLGASGVFGDSLELHASAYYQHRYEKLVDPLASQPGAALAASDPLRIEPHLDAVSALVGGTWSWESGLSLLVEAFLDPTAPSPEEWRAVRDLAVRQRSMLGSPAPAAAVLGNLAWGARFLDRPTLVRENLYARLSYKKDELELAVDALAAPQDRGAVLGAGASYETGRSRLEAAIRAEVGPSGSVYRLLPERGMLYASWKLSL